MLPFVVQITAQMCEVSIYMFQQIFLLSTYSILGTVLHAGPAVN